MLVSGSSMRSVRTRGRLFRLLRLLLLLSVVCINDYYDSSSSSSFGTRENIKDQNGSVGLSSVGFVVSAAPLSLPLIAFRTDPYDQDTVVHHDLFLAASSNDKLVSTKSTVVPYDAVDATQCPLQFSVGTAKKLHSSSDLHSHFHARPTNNQNNNNNDNNSNNNNNRIRIINAPPVLSNAFPARGPGLSVLYATSYEHVDLLSPVPLDHADSPRSTNSKRSASSSSHSSILQQKALLQASDYPLLFESSAFVTSPIVHDFNGDGMLDLLVADYDGGIAIAGIGMTSSSSSTTLGSSGTSGAAAASRYYHHAQAPRLYVRRTWLEEVMNATVVGRDGEAAAANATNSVSKQQQHEPFHSYFEYYYHAGGSGTEEEEMLIRGASSNVLGQDSAEAGVLQARRQKRNQQQQATASRRLVQTNKKDMTTEIGESDVTGREQDRSKNGQRRLLQQQQDEPNTIQTEGRRRLDERGKEESRSQQENQEVDSRRSQNEEQESERESGATHRLREEEEKSEQQQNGENGENRREGSGDEQEEQNQLNQREEESNEEERQEGGRRDSYDGESSQEDDASFRGDDRLLQDDLQIPELQDAFNPSQEEKEPDMGQATLDDDVPHSEGDLRDIDVDKMRDYDDYYKYNDQQHRSRHGLYDDGYTSHHSDYYDSKHYIRLPPHILTTPVLVEVPKLYGNTDEKEDILLVAVSYYLDEDEYEGFFSYKRFQMTDQGDETEASRGCYVASAIMAYILGDSSRWTGQTHLDLSTDFTAPENATLVGVMPMRADLTRMAAFALSSPTVADLNGNDSPDVIVGTSMGMIYAFDARQLVKRDHWPVQMKRPVEHRILVEDVLGDTNLEIFVTDIGGTIVCLDHEANVHWYRNLVTALDLPTGSRTEISASSPLTLGDVNGDGRLDLVQTIRISQRSYVFAFEADTGKDLPHFPMELDGFISIDHETFQIHHKLPQPLLVDLHTDQSFLEDYIRRNGTSWPQRLPTPMSSPAPHGGRGSGLHIVQPHGEYLFIIEGYSGCTQKIAIGEEVSAMVQVADVHATNKLDLVVSTASGNIVTLESQATYHPLNTWTGGEVRGRGNLHAHGYSASQGIFVHSSSRQFVDVFGVYVPVTFEIFDNRPNIGKEPEKRKYIVEIRDGPSWKRVLWRSEYKAPGVYSDRVYIRYGPGYYTLSVSMLTSHGLIYEDMFSIGYNVGFLDGLGVLLWLPLLVTAIVILLCGAKRTNWDDEENDSSGREGQNLGILGRGLPT